MESTSAHTGSGPSGLLQLGESSSLPEPRPDPEFRCLLRFIDMAIRPVAQIDAGGEEPSHTGTERAHGPGPASQERHPLKRAAREARYARRHPSTARLG